jgi:hypothetical protein
MPLLRSRRDRRILGSYAVVGDKAEAVGDRAMTEVPAHGGRADMEGRIIQRSLDDESFRQRLLEDPRSAIEQELGTPLPEGVEVRAVEETAQAIYLVLPIRSAEVDELSDEELESVAGGWDIKHTSGLCGTAQGWTLCGGH